MREWLTSWRYCLCFLPVCVSGMLKWGCSAARIILQNKLFRSPDFTLTGIGDSIPISWQTWNRWVEIEEEEEEEEHEERNQCLFSIKQKISEIENLKKWSLSSAYIQMWEHKDEVADDKVFTFAESCAAIGNGSRSYLAATRRHGTPNPVSSPCLATSTSSSVALLHESSSELKMEYKICSIRPWSLKGIKTITNSQFDKLENTVTNIVCKWTYVELPNALNWISTSKEP